MTATSGVTSGEAKPRVLMVLNRFIPMVGGAERQCESLMAALTGRVSWVGMLTHRYDAGLARRVDWQGVSIQRLGLPAARSAQAPWTFYLSLVWALLRQRGRYDLIHCHTSGATGLLVAVMGWLLDRPVLLKLTVEGELRTQVLAAKHSGWRAIARRALLAGLRSRRTHIVALTQSGVQEAHCAGVASVARIPNGVALPVRQVVARPVSEAGRDMFTFGFAGRLTVAKGLHVIADAFDALCASGAVAKLQLVGVFEHQEQPAQERLRGLAAKWPGRVVFGGVVSEPWPFLASCDAYVSASAHEGLPNAVLEAIAAGLPCVLSDIDGHREVRSLCPQAWVSLFNASSSEDCMRAMSVLMEMEQRPRSCLPDELAMTSVGQQYLSLYRRLMSQK